MPRESRNRVAAAPGRLAWLIEADLAARAGVSEIPHMQGPENVSAARAPDLCPQKHRDPDPSKPCGHSPIETEMCAPCVEDGREHRDSASDSERQGHRQPPLQVRSDSHALRDQLLGHRLIEADAAMRTGRKFVGRIGKQERELGQALPAAGTSKSGLAPEQHSENRPDHREHRRVHPPIARSGMVALTAQPEAEDKKDQSTGRRHRFDERHTPSEVVPDRHRLLLRDQLLRHRLVEVHAAVRALRRSRQAPIRPDAPEDVRAARASDLSLYQQGDRDPNHPQDERRANGDGCPRPVGRPHDQQYHGAHEFQPSQEQPPLQVLPDRHGTRCYRRDRPGAIQ
jgi:hypothetical protein